MQPITDYKSTNDKLRLLLQGPSGAGKTTLACQFPGAYIIDIDVNLGGTLRFLQEHKLQLPIGYDILDKDEKGVSIPLNLRYQRMNACLIEAQKNDAVETIIIDSGTTLSDVMIAEVLRQQNKTEMSKREWGFFAIVGRHFMATLASMRKHIVLIVHEKIEKDPNGSVVYPVKVAWPGQVGQNIGVFFTNVWRCEVQATPSGMQTNYKWLIRTMPEYKYELKNTLALPPLFEFNWNTIAEKLK